MSEFWLKRVPRTHLETHFEHFWALLPKQLPGRIWRVILTISTPCSQNRSQDASGDVFRAFPRIVPKINYMKHESMYLYVVSYGLAGESMHFHVENV